MSSDLTPYRQIFTSRELPSDSPLNELRLLLEYVESVEHGLSLENWRKVENALDRVARIVYQEHLNLSYGKKANEERSVFWEKRAKDAEAQAERYRQMYEQMAAVATDVTNPSREAAA